MAKKRGRTRGGLQSPGKRQLRKTYVSGNAERRRRHHLLIPWKRDAKREPHRVARQVNSRVTRISSGRQLHVQPALSAFGRNLPISRQKTAESPAENCRMRRTLVFLLFLIELNGIIIGRDGGFVKGKEESFARRMLLCRKKGLPGGGILSFSVVTCVATPPGYGASRRSPAVSRGNITCTALPSSSDVHSVRLRSPLPFRRVLPLSPGRSAPDVRNALRWR